MDRTACHTHTRSHEDGADGWPPPWRLSVWVDLARATSTVAWDEVMPSVLHGEREEGDEVVRHCEKARSAADDDEDGCGINRIGRLNSGTVPGGDRAPRGGAVAKADGVGSKPTRMMPRKNVNAGMNA